MRDALLITFVMHVALCLDDLFTISLSFCFSLTFSMMPIGLMGDCIEKTYSETKARL